MIWCSQDRLQIGYCTLTHTLRWFHKRATELESEEYVEMLKMVDFHDVSYRLGLTQLFFSFVKGLTLLEGTIHPN